VITENIGDILEVQEGIVVHGCNCQGVMGSGIAHSIRSRWPAVYEEYKRRHSVAGLFPGDVCFVSHPQLLESSPILNQHIHGTTTQLPPRLVVANAMTQFEFGRDSTRIYVDYDAVSAAFARIAIVARDSGLSIHFPLIGCGLANGQWSRVAQCIQAAVPHDANLTLWKLPA
jgi:O-acetyl-ADP-ribose deacetylase (regulator of RNase III)